MADEKTLANAGNAKTSARARERRRSVLRVQSGDLVAGRQTLTADLQPIAPGQSFEFSLTEAKVHRQALETALAAGDDSTVAITAPALTAAIEHAHRAIENSPAERARMMLAELEPIERDAERLLAQRDKASLSADRLVDAAVKETDNEQRYKVLFNVIVQAKNREVLPQVVHELRARPHRIHGNYLDALTRLIRVNGSSGLRDLALFELERAGVASPAEASVVRMTRYERLKTAAKLGAPDLPIEALDQIAGFFFGLPIAIGIGALVAAEIIPAAAASLLLLPATYEIANDLTAYRNLAAEAGTVADLRAAGAYFAKAITAIGLTALLAFVAKAKAGKSKTSALRKTAKTSAAEPAAEPAQKPVAETAPKHVANPAAEAAAKPSAPAPQMSESERVALARAKHAGTVIKAWVENGKAHMREGWKLELTVGGPNEIATTKIKITIRNVQDAPRAPTSATKGMRAELHETGRIDKGYDAGHGVASAIASCEELLNYFNEKAAFNRNRKAPVEKALVAKIKEWDALGQQVTFETVMTLKDEPGIPQTVGQTYRLTSSAGEIFEPPPVK